MRLKGKVAIVTGAGGGFGEVIVKPCAAMIPLGRLSAARDIADAALYLASDEADFITGVELPVDGSRTV